MYDRPFQWGSKRTGPTLRASAASIPTIGIAIISPHRSRWCQGTVMPAYPWLARTELDIARYIADDLKRRLRSASPTPRR